MNGFAYVFLNRKGAGGLGHVGCAFLLRNGLVRCMSTENQVGHPYTSAAYKGFWTQDCPNNFASIVNLFQTRKTVVIPPGAKDKNGFNLKPGTYHSDPYTEWKRLDVQNVNPEQATWIMNKRSGEGYSITDRNCQNDVYDILHDEGSGYGITANSFVSRIYIGWVQTAFGPNAWFDGNIGASAHGYL
ncbi:hypothetical protein [Algoriphagus sediminis]|uniref:Uncharacterized protein n=1 Tax=Algoriphagus sediminis TaxID=3057113 RepID=A0ABT7YEK8_9BACT|nr:hypothetical protein [Algoriphagus sediminis]MDN3204961.1 hypothetical protein [Algoriphagus sediminis]